MLPPEVFFLIFSLRVAQLWASQGAVLVLVLGKDAPKRRVGGWMEKTGGHSGWDDSSFAIDTFTP